MFPPPSGTAPQTQSLLAPLAAAQDALARLDAQADLISPALRDGLIARLAFAEAAGRLAASGGFVHPLDLALRAAERLGRRELMTRGHPAQRPHPDDHAWLEMDENIRRALHLARLLQRLPAADDPLATVETAHASLAPLGPPTAFDAGRFAAWHAAHWPDRRRRDASPALLRAAEAASTWMSSGIAGYPDAAPALAAAAMLLRRTATLRCIPLPVWASWTTLCAAADPGTLPRLRGDVAARLVGPAGASWPVVFLHMTAEAARAGARTLAVLRQAEAAATALAARHDRRSRLPAAIGLLLHHPALTAACLARHLAITPQAALRILGQLAAAGIIAEITGRKSFRAFAIR